MPRVVKSLALFPPAPVEAPRFESRPAPSRSQLWIAVCLPSLALECLSAPDRLARQVVVEAEQGQLHVVASSQAAVDVGIVAGMKLSAAMALEATLQVFERAPLLERASLESLASWAHTLTSQVSLEAPESLLLEVAGSFKLFGSFEAIKAKLSEELARRYRDYRVCAAPTATGALWLARAASDDALQQPQLGGRLAALPLAVTRWPPAVQALLQDLGLRTVGDSARLPRDGFARRVGRRYLVELDRAFGRAHDLRAEFKAPTTWKARAELSEESVDSAVFLEALEQLLDALAVELKRRQVQIGRLEIAFEHLHRPPTVESFDLREPTHDRDRLLDLIEDRLERSVLPVPAVALRIESDAFRPLELEEAGLFETKPLEQREQVLLERLQERFGLGRVYGLRTVAEHRPEKAWDKNLESDGRRVAPPWQHREARPLWLLPAPVEASRDSLELVSGPERIESGWWDEHDVTRDYYTAKNDQGQTLWVFRDHRTRGWFLHGLFG
ncbi:MAG TPA: DNA polymerase Y family protein [Gammaproteobacteria bacterium]|nr:DNA polymerase Y family protein [Gammaproteobacteria bacterium]